MADETAEERDARIREEWRREKNSMAHDASPQAGEELDIGSDAYKAKEQMRVDARKKLKDNTGK